MWTDLHIKQLPGPHTMTHHPQWQCCNTSAPDASICRHSAPWHKSEKHCPGRGVSCQGNIQEHAGKKIREDNT